MNNHYKDIISEKYKKILFIHGWGFTRQILIDNFDTACSGQAIFIDLYEHMIDTNGDLKTAAQNILRENNINSEIFLDSKKNLGKQLTLANKRELPVAIICGENEFNDKTITIKNLQGQKGENSKTIPKEKLIDEVKKII